MVELSAYIPSGQTGVHRLRRESKKEGLSIGQIVTHLPETGSPTSE